MIKIVFTNGETLEFERKACREEDWTQLIKTRKGWTVVNNTHINWDNVCMVQVNVTT